MKKYILDSDGNPELCTDLLKWAAWFETANDQRVVKKTDVTKGIEVSTVFLGLDHSFGGGKTPMLYETMIFGGDHDQYQERFATRESALKGHEEAVDIAKS